METSLLAVNAGSSSLKFALFEFSEAGGLLEIARGSTADAADEHAADRLLEWAAGHLGGDRLDMVGHRVVHGGPSFRGPVEIEDDTVHALEALTPLAPLHQPAGLAPMRRMRALRPDLRQFACFDTTFHRGIVPPAARYALPRALEAQGIRRYGFHGLSYQAIAEQLRAEEAGGERGRPSRIIVAHLGSGASLCALQAFESVDTTMGFSVLDGLVMGSRPGSLDPGILLYLLQEKKVPPAELERMLYRQSGLLGVSGISGDMKTLLQSDEPQAFEALELFAFQAARQTASLAATLGGVDRFVFTGGVGENAPAVRAMIAGRLHWMGADLDQEANMSGARIISSTKSSILLEWRRTDEERMIAKNSIDFARAR